MAKSWIMITPFRKISMVEVLQNILRKNFFVAGNVGVGHFIQTESTSNNHSMEQQQMPVFHLL